MSVENAGFLQEFAQGWNDLRRCIERRTERIPTLRRKRKMHLIRKNLWNLLGGVKDMLNHDIGSFVRQ